jgi:cation:H+ antiporter
LDILLIILFLLGGLLGLHFGATWLVLGSSRLALAAGIKPLIIGLTLVAFGTSAPELTVSLGAAIQGQQGISVGNVIGSNIANIGLVLGLSAMIRPIPVSREVFKRDIPAMLLFTLLIVVLPFIGGPVDTGEGVAFRLDRWKGVVLLLAMAVFLWRLMVNARDTSLTPDEMRVSERARRLPQAAMALAGLAVLLLGGKLFVDGAVDAAELLGVPELVIGLTVVAVGTSLPELATSMIAIIRKEGAISLGNVVGSNIFNLGLVLGIVAVVQPLLMDARVMRLDMIAMLAFTLAMPLLAWRGGRLTRVEGTALLAAYVLYVLNLFFGWV